MIWRNKILPITAALLLVAAGTLAGCQHWRLRCLKFDDAWIHLRYAANLASGKGFVYNEGERVLGSAGVLWNFAMALMAKITGIDNLPAAVSVLNALLLFGCVVAIVLALREVVPGWLGALISAVLLSQGPLLVSSIGGMETTALCLLQILCLLALVQRRYALACLAAGTSVCFRIEGAALIMATALAVWLYERKRFAELLPWLLGVPAAVFGWSWWYFGSPIANSTMAKRIVYATPPGDAVRWCTEALVQTLPFWRALPLLYEHPAAQRIIGLLIIVLLAWFGFRLLRAKAPAAALVVLPAFAPFVVYAIANPLMFPWYACTFVPMTTLLVFLGVFEICRRISSSRPDLGDLLAFSIILSFAIAPLKTTWPSLSPPESPDFSFQAPNAKENTRTYRYASVARWLNTQAGPNDRVCISEIGSFGYHFKGRILDGLGLISPEALKYHPVPYTMRPDGTYGVIAPGVVREYRPEFVVSLDIFAGALFADPWFQESYREIGRGSWFDGPARWKDLPARLWGASEIHVYRRR